MIIWNVYDEHGVLRQVYFEPHDDIDQCSITMPSYVDQRLEMQRTGVKPGLDPSQRISISYPYEDVRVYRKPKRGSYVTYLRSRCPRSGDTKYRYAAFESSESLPDRPPDNRRSLRRPIESSIADAL